MNTLYCHWYTAYMDTHYHDLRKHARHSISLHVPVCTWYAAGCALILCAFGFGSILCVENVCYGYAHMHVWPNPQKYRVRHGCCTSCTNVSGARLRCCARNSGTGSKFHKTHRSYYIIPRSVGYGYQSLVETTEVSGTVWMLYRIHEGIGYGYKTYVNRTPGRGDSFLQNTQTFRVRAWNRKLQKCRVRVISFC